LQVGPVEEIQHLPLHLDLHPLSEEPWNREELRYVEVDIIVSRLVVVVAAQIALTSKGCRGPGGAVEGASESVPGIRLSLPERCRQTRPFRFIVVVTVGVVITASISDDIATPSKTGWNGALVTTMNGNPVCMTTRPKSASRDILRQPNHSVPE
jgi:hypothetical protein